MPYSFTPTMKPFVISSLFDSIKASRPTKRFARTQYSLGAQVVNSNYRYICVQAGTTGPGIGPTASTGIASDGTVQWLAMGIETFNDGDILSNLYLGIGKQSEWSDPLTPPAPDTSYDGENEAIDDVTAFIKLSSDNLRIAITNVPWTSGTVYSQYDPSTNQLNYPTPHYCIVNDTLVYKCIDNNNGAPSTAEPSGLTEALIETADGYIWKLVGSIAVYDQYNFSTSTFAPLPATMTAPVEGEISTFIDTMSVGDSFDSSSTIMTTVIGDGEGANAAARTSVSGADMTITGIYATAGGVGYTEAFAVAWDEAATGEGALINAVVDAGGIDSISVTETGEDYVDATVLIIGDGTGASATATIAGGQITAIVVDDAGTGYTWARAFVVPGTAGAIARAVFSPTSGHGSDLATELGVHALLISTKLSPSLNDYIPTEPVSPDGSFRQITLVSGVMGTETSDRNAIAYLGKSNYRYETNPLELNKYRDGSGYVLYINNVAAITHTSSQEEVIKISISL